MKAIIVAFGLALVGLFVWSLIEGKNSVQHAHALEDSLRVKQLQVDSLTARIAVKDTQYIETKVVDTKAVGDYRKLRDSLRRVTAERPESIPTSPAEVALLQETLNACDSALAADSLVVSLCEARISQRDTTIQWQREVIRGKDQLITLIRNADTCHYLVLRGPCPVIGVGLSATTGAGGTSVGPSIGVLFPIKTLRF